MAEKIISGFSYPPLLKYVPANLVMTEKGQSPAAIAIRENQVQVIARVGFRKPISQQPCSSAEGYFSYAWKNAEQAEVRTIQGKEIVFVNAAPYHTKATGGDIHGVVGGLTQAFDWNPKNRPDVQAATHFSYYAFIESGSAYISVEFFDHDPGTPGANGGFSSNLNLDAANGGKPGISEVELLERSGGRVNMKEYLQSRYDGYRWRIYGSDGWKAQKLLVSGNKRLYRIQIPFDKAFVEKYFINTGFGNNQFDIHPEELERIQFIFYVTEKPGEPVTHYKRGMTLQEYQEDPTAYTGTSTGYRFNETVQVGVGTELLFIKDEQNLGRIVITPIE